MRKMKIIPETVKKFNSSDAYFVIKVALSYPLKSYQCVVKTKRFTTNTMDYYLQYGIKS